jgi:hypothetical protein
LAKTYAKRAGPEIHTEVLTSFVRNRNGTFTKVVKTPTRDWKTGMKKKGPIKPVETGPYTTTMNPEEADESQSYEDIDGTLKQMYFRLLALDEIEVEDDTY